MGAQHHEVIIVGGGMVGATLAALLGQAGVSVAVLDGAEPDAWSADTPPDLRVSSINAASLQVLEAAGAWPGIAARRHNPFRRLRVWEVSGRGETAFSADDIGADVLGHFVENNITRLALWERLALLPSVTRICPALPEGIEPRGSGALTLRLRDGRRLSCRLLVGADGARSAVRTIAGIGVESHDYRQHAMITNVLTRLPQQDVTWQCFTPDGPVAFLPLQGPHASLVWYDRPDVVRRRLALSDEALRLGIEAAFPSDLGGIVRVSGPRQFPDSPPACAALSGVSVGADRRRRACHPSAGRPGPQPGPAGRRLSGWSSGQRARARRRPRRGRPACRLRGEAPPRQSGHDAHHEPVSSGVCR
jgi:3-demethoxyubiquinol 3-hydroxylase